MADPNTTAPNGFPIFEIAKAVLCIELLMLGSVVIWWLFASLDQLFEGAILRRRMDRRERRERRGLPPG